MKKFVLFECDKYGEWIKREDFDSEPDEIDILHYAEDNCSEYFVFSLVGKYEVETKVKKVVD